MDIDRVTTLASLAATTVPRSLLSYCPMCGYPYASSFTGYEYVLTEQEVCNGSQSLRLCRPTKYLAVPIPETSLDVDMIVGEQRYQGVVYQVKEAS